MNTRTLPWLVLLVASSMMVPPSAAEMPVLSVPPRLAPAALQAPAGRAPAPHIAEIFGLPPLARLAPSRQAAGDSLAALHAWNAAGRVPVKNGFERRLPAPRSVELTAALQGAGPVEHDGGMLAPASFAGLSWGASVEVAEAARIRLHLAGVHLPAGARLWVHGGGEEVGPFGTELIAPDGGLWAPSVAGEVAAIDVELPAGAFGRGDGQGAHERFGFTLDKVAELVPQSELESTACNVDASCDLASSPLRNISNLRHAIARLEFMDQGSGFLCSGGLLATSDPQAQVPYLLTANHCISSQDSAASLDAAFDYYTTSCNGGAPDLSTVPHVNGSTLIATGSADTASDYTLLRLSSLPPGRAFLGWTSAPTPDGALLYRLSHPSGMPLNYVVTRASYTVPDCGGPRPFFLYSTMVTGGTFGGSSGSPALLASGQVVGQLYGGCNNPDDCSPDQFTIDGAFFSTFQDLQPFLTATPGVCHDSSTTLCLMGHRFAVNVTWQNQFNNTSGVGHAVHRSDSTGFFYFTDPSNDELILKILDLGGVIKVFYGQLTNLKFNITVTDTSSGLSKQYQNGPGDCGAIDENAFAADLAGGAGQALAAPVAAPARASCVADRSTLCLLGHRIAVRVSWANQFDGSSGKGAEQPLSDESGLFSFTDPTNVELVVKALPFDNNVIKFFYGALSDLQYTITATDTTTGTTKTYSNPAGTFCGGIDDNAF